jgi:hypothetical protein
VAKPKSELYAETLREIGLLMVVFAPLDILFRAEHGTLSDWITAGTVAIVGLIFIEIGVRMEAEK